MSTKNATEQTLDTAAAIPIAEVRPVVRGYGLWPQIVALAKYMVKTEVHTYAFSVAANVILSLFPFIVMMMTISRQVFHSETMAHVVGEMMSTFLPSNLTNDHSFIMDRMFKLANPHKGAQIYSVIMLLISSTGVFLPLEVALNGVWGVHKNRSYAHNQVVSLGLAFAAGVLAMTSVALSTAQKSLFAWLFTAHTNSLFFKIVFFGHADSIFSFISGFLYGSLLRILAMVVSILIFFLIYWILPNRKVPARAVLPTAITIGLLWEAAKYLYVLALPKLDFPSVYGPFYVSVGLMIWAFLSGLLLLAGAHFSATRFALSVAREEARAKQSEAGASDVPEIEAHAERV